MIDGPAGMDGDGQRRSAFAARLPDERLAAGAPAPAQRTGDASLLLRAFEQSQQGWLWATDAVGRITYISAEVGSRLGPQPVEGTALTDLFERIDEAGEQHRNLPFLLGRRVAFQRVPVRAIAGEDRRSWALSGEPFTDSDGGFAGYRGSAVDITEQRRSSDEASQLALYDPLTNLPNRNRIADLLERSLLACRLQKRSCAVLLLDLDRFKQVNDTLGHPAGDALLVQVARRLQKITGDREMVSRIGGDEFQLVVPGPFETDDIARLADSIIRRLSEPFVIEGSRCVIGASVGIAIAPQDGESREELIRNADLALYEAKSAGRGVHRFFSSRLLQEAADKRRLEEDLRDALANDQLDLFYQPIVRSSDNVTTGVEALVRWTHPERGPISPAIFIPIAEEANLIESLGEWVLRRACRDAAGWPGALRVAVNVSPIQFTGDNMIALVRSALAESGLVPSRLELEITEGVFLQDSTRSERMFIELKQIGVRLALDDFGTGYSSLGYLKSTPFDKIKIDQSFVRAATLPTSRNRAIISAIVALAGALNMETTAEGVETLDELELIRSLGVSHVQGYVYSRPVSGAALLEHATDGSWSIQPEGPKTQRAERHSMFRRASAIVGNFSQPIIIRNLSESGALIEGLSDVPLDTLLLINFGEGQLSFARVKRSMQRRQGIEFEQPLLRDAGGGFRTRQRLSSYALSMAGLPQADGEAPPDWGSEREQELEQLRQRLGIDAGETDAAQDGDPNDAAGPKAGNPDAPDAATGAKLTAEANDQGGTGTSAGRGIGHGTGASIRRDGTVAGGGVAETRATDGRFGPTIAQIAQRYLATPDRHRGRSDLDRFFLEKHILPRFGRENFGRLSISTVSSWLAEKGREPGSTPARIERLHALMGQIFMIGLRWNHGQRAGADVSAPAGGREPRFVERRLTPKEMERLDTATRESGNLQLNAIVRLMILTGTRQRETLAARWDQIDLATGMWRIPAGKGGSSRDVTLSRDALALIAELPRWDGCPWLLPNPTTKKPYRSIYNSWDVARQKAGLTDLEIDDLRFSMPEEEEARAAPRSRQFLARMVGGHG